MGDKWEIGWEKSLGFGAGFPELFYCAPQQNSDIKKGGAAASPVL